MVTLLGSHPVSLLGPIEGTLIFKIDRALGNESAYDFVELCHYCHETVTAVRRIKNISTAEATEIVRQWRERR
jgi:hypothetical protein